MKHKKYIIQIVIGLALAAAVMFARGVAEAENTAEVLLAVGDGFTVTALLFLSFGGLFWVATTGIFDIFGYALRKGAHALIPGMIHDSLGGFYDYKMNKAENRKKKMTELSTLIVGCGFLAVSVALTIAWYMVV